MIFHQKLKENKVEETEKVEETQPGTLVEAACEDVEEIIAVKADTIDLWKNPRAVKLISSSSHWRRL